MTTARLIDYVLSTVGLGLIAAHEHSMLLGGVAGFSAALDAVYVATMLHDGRRR